MVNVPYKASDFPHEAGDTFLHKLVEPIPVQDAPSFKQKAKYQESVKLVNISKIFLVSNIVCYQNCYIKFDKNAKE